MRMININKTMCEFLHNITRHRINGPAYIKRDNIEFWFKKGKFHNLNGPAKIFKNSPKDNSYFIEGIYFISKEDYLEYLETLNV